MSAKGRHITLDYTGFSGGGTSTLTITNSSQFGRGVVGSFGFWSDDVDALAKQIQNNYNYIKKDMTFGGLI